MQLKSSLINFPQKSGYFAGLDGLRAIAVLLVVSHHAGFFYAGWIGVPMFFVLSGFLITRSLIKQDQASFKRYVGHFYWRRLLRIFPLYYFYLSLVLIVVIVLKFFISYQHQEIDNIISSIQYAYLYLYNFYQASSAFLHTSFLAHFWSLAIEEQFYLIWPLFIFFLSKKRLVILCIALIMITPVIRHLSHELLPPLSFTTRDDFLWASSLVYVLPTSHMDAFALGALLNFVKLKQVRLLAYFALFILLVLLSQTRVFFPFLAEHYGWIWGFSTLNFCFAAMLVASIHQLFLPKLLDSKLFRYVGKISYGIYVYHYGVCYFVQQFYPETGLIRLGLSILISVIVAGLSYQFLEKRFLRLKRVGLAHQK